MPIQAPPWTEYLNCPVCENAFELRSRLPISISFCGHTICKACLSTLQRRQCPFDQCSIQTPIDKLPINTALALLVDQNVELDKLRLRGNDQEARKYNACMLKMEKLASYLRPVTSPSGNSSTQLSRPMQRKLVSLINCQLMEVEGRSRAVKAARSLGERSVTELILQHQNPQQLSANLWAAVRARGCQFLGPAMQEEVLKLVLLALEDGSALSRKVLVMFVVQRLEPHFPQASKTSIGHVVQLLYRASCFKVTKRDGDSSLMQLKEEFRTYDTLRREHDAQIVQIATEAGLRIAPDQWSSLLYGDPVHKSHMQSIIDKLQTPQSFVQSVQELVIALQRTGDPGHLTALRPHLDHLASIEVGEDGVETSEWDVLTEALTACCNVVAGLLTFIAQHIGKKISQEHHESAHHGANGALNARYKTSMCRDLAIHGSCPRGKNCTFAHSMAEIETYRSKRGPSNPPVAAATATAVKGPLLPARASSVLSSEKNASMQTPPPVAQVAPLPRGGVEGTAMAAVQQQQQSSTMMVRPQAATTPVAIYEQQVINGVPVQVPTGVVNMAMAYQEVPVMVGPSHGTPGAAVLMEDHLEELRRNQTSPDAQQFPHDGVDRTRMAAKSLSALKSRKEQIMDTLEDIVGRDEMERLTMLTQERAKGGKSIGALSVAIGVSTPSVMTEGAVVPESSCYSMWTSRSIATLSVSTPSLDAGPIPTYTNEPLGYFVNSMEDEVIPFSDTPQVSRFGPISRRGTSIIRPSKPSQSVAIIDDEPMPTAVVRHSKQIAQPLPPTASLFLQNGARTALQPVAVGVNGEIGYIAVQEPAMVPMTAPPSAAAMQTPEHGVDAASVFAESERMKHELEVLQRKISNLNMAQQHQQYQLMQQQQQHVVTSGPSSPEVIEKLPTSVAAAAAATAAAATMNSGPTHAFELASELQLIEKTIRDREMEIQINTCMQRDSPQGLDYGSYITHGLIDGNGQRHPFIPSSSSSHHGTMTYSAPSSIPSPGVARLSKHFG